MLTTRTPWRTAETERAPGRYAVSLQLHYRVTSQLGLAGFGQTIMMSSQDIVFVPSDGLEPGMNAEIVVDWPPLLDNRIRLQLVLQVTITGSQDGEAEARIRTYDFCTRQSGGAPKQIALQGGGFTADT